MDPRTTLVQESSIVEQSSAQEPSPRTISEPQSLVDYEKLGENKDSRKAVEAALLRARTLLLEEDKSGPLLNYLSNEGHGLQFKIGSTDLLLGNIKKRDNPSKDMVCLAEAVETQSQLRALDRLSKMFVEERARGGLYLTVGTAHLTEMFTEQQNSTPRLFRTVQLVFST